MEGHHQSIKIFSSLAIGCFALLLAACIVMFCKTCTAEYRRPLLPHLEVLALPVIPDSVRSEGEFRTHTDSVISDMQCEIAALRSDNEYIRRLNENLMNDFRQETNNDINKINAWLAFWIATSALLCIVVPMVFQHMSVIGERRRFQSKLEEAEKELERKKKQISAKVEQAEKNIEALEKRHHVWHSRIAIESGIECDLMNPAKGVGTALGRHLWSQLSDSLKDVVEAELKDSRLSDSNRYRLMEYLLDIRSYTFLLRRSIPGRHNRVFTNIEDQVNSLFHDIDANQLPQSELKELFQTLINDFRALCGRVER